MAHMQDFPLLLSTLYDHAVWIHPDQEIVSVESDRSLTRTTYAETDARVRKLASAFDALGIEPGGAVGTFAWNNIRHHELYWATANTGRICHTINIRLFADQIVYVANHARDQAMFVDPDLVPLMAPLASQMETVKHWVIMGPEASDELPGSIAYDDLIADQPEHGHWPLLDERSPMMLCYSSGTTGHPKGVAYAAIHLSPHGDQPGQLPERLDNVLPVVPMFHAAWGYPYMSVTRAKLTYPGPDLSPQGLVNSSPTRR